ncbi:hypothetical protein KY362_00195 [Candidatus Woesearchaeota archaeon]|nr:hypothetical protein [Candidatus Woesearchaeota archaeon]
MKKGILFGAIALLIAIGIIAGCEPKPTLLVEEPVEAPAEEPLEEANVLPVDETGRPVGELKDKRGEQTNITEFDKLMQRFSKVGSYTYKITDTAYDNEAHQFYVKGRFVRRVLNDAYYHESGAIYDEVLMDRVTRQAFTHCGTQLCPKPNPDKEVEQAGYSEYYMNDPYEHITRFTDAEYIGEKLLEDQYTKVFRGNYDGQAARAWVQEYYGFPIRIEAGSDDNKRIIKFEDMMVDATRNAEVRMPFNFTIQGEGKAYWNWESYLGIDQMKPEYDAEGEDILPLLA